MKQHITPVAIDAYAWVEVTTSLLNSHLTEKYKVDLPEVRLNPTINVYDRRFSHHDARAWVMAQIDYEFNNQMHWTKAIGMEFLDTLVTRFNDVLVNGHRLEPVKESELQIELEDLLAPITHQIYEAVKEYVSPNPWRIWLLNARYDTMLVEGSDDFRVEYFNLKYEAGEWAV